MDKAQWTPLSPVSEVWSNQWMRVVEFHVQMPTGIEAKFYAVAAPDGVAILAIDENRCVVLNRQYRPALERVIFELPSGQPDPGEDLHDTALRELAEEAGVVGTDIQHLGTFYRNPGRDTGSMHIFFARAIGSVPTQQEQYEYLETVRIPLQDLLSEVMNNQIHDICTAYAVLMLQQHILEGNIHL